MTLANFAAEFAAVFAKALFPLIFFCGIGALADRFLEIDRQSLSRLLVYVFMPALVFSTLLKVEVSHANVLRVVVFTLIILSGMAASGWVYARILKMDRESSSSAILAVTFFNAVNLGFPISLFAFGDEGFRLAAVLVAAVSIPHNGFGLLIAARGTLSNRQALTALLRMPLVYVLTSALLIRWAKIPVPEMFLEPVKQLGHAGVPLVLVLIGMELGRIKIGAFDGKVLGVVVLRLLFAPLLAWGVAEMVGLTGLLKSVVILQASMPSAIMPIVYARMFGGNVEFVSKAVFYSTTGCIVTIPVILLLLKS